MRLAAPWPLARLRDNHFRSESDEKEEVPRVVYEYEESGRAALSMKQHVVMNAAYLDSVLLNRSVGADDVIFWSQTSKALQASSMTKYCCMCPHLYRSDGLFERRASFQGFEEECLKLLPESPKNPHAAYMLSLSVDPEIAMIMETFGQEFIREVDILIWMSSVLGICATTYRQNGVLRKSTETKRGVHGAVPFGKVPFQRDFNSIRFDTAYVGYCDYTINVGISRLTKAFLVIELKSIKDEQVHRAYYEACAILSELICSFFGSSDSVAALGLCQFGFVLLWRSVVRNRDGIKEYAFFMYPDHGGWRFCIGPDGEEGKRDLLRILGNAARIGCGDGSWLKPAVLPPPPKKKRIPSMDGGERDSPQKKTPKPNQSASASAGSIVHAPQGVIASDISREPQIVEDSDFFENEENDPSPTNSSPRIILTESLAPEIDLKFIARDQVGNEWLFSAMRESSLERVPFIPIRHNRG